MTHKIVDIDQLARHTDTEFRVRNYFTHCFSRSLRTTNMLELEYLYDSYRDPGIMPPRYALFQALESRGKSSK
jgi:hypothetical protein